MQKDLPVCPADTKQVGMVCLYFSSTMMTFDAAETYCQDRGSHLASVTSIEEADLIRTTVNELFGINAIDAYYIGKGVSFYLLLMEEN